MTVLFATAHWPHPLPQFRHGTALRMRMLLRAASQLGLPVDLLVYQPADTLAEQPDPAAWRDDFARLWGVPVRHIHRVPQEPWQGGGTAWWRDYLRPALSARWQPAWAITAGRAQVQGLQQALQRSAPALLLQHRLPTMLPLLALRGPRPPVLLDLDDIEHKAFARALALPPHWGAKRLMRLWVPALRRLERAAVRLADATMVCSEADAAELRRLHGRESVWAVPNALPVPMPAPLPEAPVVTFVGLYRYAPNREAAEYLIDAIWPRIRAAHPGARLWIAGSQPQAIKQYASPPPGVEFLGFVDDLDALYAQTRVAVCPVRSGGGTRIKIIEAALQQRPVVSTTVGAEGLDLSAARGEIAMADDPETFAAAVGALLVDTPRALRQAQAAQQRARSTYDEESVARRLSARMQTLLDAAPSPTPHPAPQ